MEFNKAKHFDIGVTIFTKDGSKIGNAIIYAISEFANRPVYHIETDFGNRTRLFYEELDAWFTPGYKTMYTDWCQQRKDALDGQ